MVLIHSDSSQAGESLPALTVIRQATAQCHTRMEQNIDWSAAFSSPERYVDLLQRFHRVVVPLEAVLGQVASQDNPHDTTRSERLRHDMRSVAECYFFEQPPCALSHDPFTLKDTFPIDTTTAWGVSYVLEGSALGGQILSRQLQECKSQWLARPEHVSQCDDAVIDRYFVGRGAATGSHWRVFCQQLNDSLSNDCAANRAAEAAVQTFEYFHSSLVGKAVCFRR